MRLKKKKKKKVSVDYVNGAGKKCLPVHPALRGRGRRVKTALIHTWALL